MISILFIVPILLWLAFAIFGLKWKISPIEAGLQLLITVGAILAIFSLGSYSSTYDTKLVNGRVTELQPIKRDCPSGWRLSKDDFCTNYDTREVRDPDICTTDSKGNRSCTPNYHTEYRSEYSWERRYWVNTSVGRYEIPRVDRQGVTEPPRFTASFIGQPAVASVNYENFIKGASDTLFSEGEPEGELPLAYPKIRDFYFADRFLVEGLSFPNELWQKWNAALAEQDAKLEAVNLIVVVTNSDKTFATKLARSWDSHNINDVIVVIGSSDGQQIDWVDVRSWSATERVNIEIRDALKTRGSLTNYEGVISDIGLAITAYFEEQPMENFEYLADDIPPPTWAIVLAFIFLLLVTPGLSYIFHLNDHF